MNKIRCSVLALLMAISPLSVFASTIEPVAPPGNTPVTLNTTPLTFNATVPTGLPLDLAANGVVAPATEASIINGAIGPIKVVSITTTAVEDWVLTSYTDDFSTKKVNSKDIALQFNQDNVTAAGSIVLTPQNWPTIAGNDSLKLDYQGKLAPQSEGFTKAIAANVSFVLDWDSSISTPESPVDKYVMATDEDFSGTVNSTDYDTALRYIGTDKYVEVPHVIKGVPVTSYYLMFSGTSVEGVKSTNKNITDMSYMFWSSNSTTLDVSSFNTSNVTDMDDMFRDSKATTLDLSSFDTSKVTSMYDMFDGSQATTLDVSSFNTSKVTDMSSMFISSQATTLDVSNFDTSNVTDMNFMFANSQATTLDLSNFNTSKVTTMSRMFASSKATTLDLSNFDTSKVTTMDYMFDGSSATTLDLSNFDTFNVTTMEYMFDGSSATTLDLSSFDTSNVTDMSDMFYGSQATTLDLSSFDTSNVTTMERMFISSKATTGYARTQTDADNFNASESKPATLTFTVK